MPKTQSDYQELVSLIYANLRGKSRAEILAKQQELLTIMNTLNDSRDVYQRALDTVNRILCETDDEGPKQE